MRNPLKGTTDEDALVTVGDAICGWMAEVAKAAESFERRWTWSALHRVNQSLHDALVEQRGLFREMTFQGDVADVREHGGAMCRGYAAAVRAMEDAGEPDDAYLIGQDPKTGFRIAIGHHKAAAGRVAELYGEAVPWFSPDEVAATLAAVEWIRSIANIKKQYPGAEIISFRESAA